MFEKKLMLEIFIHQFVLLLTDDTVIRLWGDEEEKNVNFQFRQKATK